MSETQTNILEEYANSRDAYMSYARTLTALLERLLVVNSVPVHSINFRCKTVESLAGKVARKEKYKSLSEVTDLAGVRIITLFSSDVDVVAELIEREFVIDRANSIDKRVALDPDRFGYLSLHYVISLNQSRGELQEYAGFAPLKLELQIRSILQHTWAEIEHDIGYKSVAEVPKQIRRRFSRLAGLLELADQEFTGIRKELDEYAVEVDDNIQERAEEILLDKVSLQTFVGSNQLCVELDSLIAKMRNAKQKESLVNMSLLVGMELIGVKTLGAVEKNLELHRADIIRRAEDVAINSSPVKHVQYGICLFFLVQVMVAKTKDRALIDKYVLDNEWTQRFADYLMAF